MSNKKDGAWACIFLQDAAMHLERQYGGSVIYNQQREWELYKNKDTRSDLCAMKILMGLSAVALYLDV